MDWVYLLHTNKLFSYLSIDCVGGSVGSFLTLFLINYIIVSETIARKRARSLVVSDLRSETKGSRFDSGY